MPNHPKTSIVIITHNMGNYLPCAVNSVLTQADIDWEIVIVDDGSTDSTPQYLASIVHPKIQLHSNDVKKGYSYSRNVALSLARGEFISTLDADDWFLPKKLQIHSEILSQDTSIGVVCSRAIVLTTYNGTFEIDVRPPHNDEERWDLASPHTMVHSASTWRKEDILRCGGYDETLPFAEEVDLFLKVGDSKRQVFTPDLVAVKRECIPPEIKSRNRLNSDAVSKSIYEKTLLRRYGRAK